jgi:murein DD-endopeptidase MepM/ murein hydrolase activator NlpD
VSDTVPRHRKLPEFDDAQRTVRSRHRKQETPEARARKARRTGLTAGVGAAVVVMAAALVIGLPALRSGAAAGARQAATGPVTETLGSSVAGDASHALDQNPADVAGSSPFSASASAKPTAGRPAAAKSSAPKRGAKTPVKSAAAKTQHAATMVYLNPLRKISGLMAERIDMGADFGGSGPVYAIGDAVITNATGDSPGWPGGGWITYQLTDGPASGLVVYLAEDVTPSVQVGQHVTPNTVIASMYNGSAGIETGWAMPDSSSAESQLPAAGGISGGGPFPTAVGINFEHLLEALGVPESPFNGSATPYGAVPSGYPANYSSLKS